MCENIQERILSFLTVDVPLMENEGEIKKATYPF